MIAKRRGMPYMRSRSRVRDRGGGIVLVQAVFLQQESGGFVQRPQDM